jgi:hypothetical protein
MRSVIEQVAQYRAARRRVGLDADEQRQLAVGGNVLFGEQIADMAGTLPRVIEERRPDPFLLLVVVRHREGHQAIERHTSLAVGGDQFRADHGQLEPLAHDLRGHAETGGEGAVKSPLGPQNKNTAAAI